MRVTDRMIFDGALRSTLQARVRADRAALVAGTGVRVAHPGDDPAAMGGVVAGRSAEARFESIRKVADGARDELVQADAALGSVSTMVRRAEQLAIQLANGSYDADARAAGAHEVEALIAGVTAALDGKYGDRYLFGGNTPDVPPFAADGTFQGGAGARSVEIAPGVFEDVAPDAGRAIAGAGGGTDVLAAMRALAAALAANDGDAVQGQIAGLGAGLKQIAAERARIGGSVAVLESASAAALEARDGAKAQVAGLTEADVVAAASELALSQRALEAALAAASESFRLSLLDKF